MQRLLILAEGQTEENFIKNVLAPYLRNLNIYVYVSIVRTKEPPAGKPFRGGLLNYEKVRKDIFRLLDDTDALVTTMFDLYGLPGNFPGLGVGFELLNARGKVSRVQNAFERNIDHRRFFPFIMLHEFEALVLASPQTLGDHFNSFALTQWCTEINRTAGGPEMVNDGRDTAPSKRLSIAITDYKKVFDGPAIIAKEGWAAVRSRCPHFNNWIVWLESLAPAAVI